MNLDMDVILNKTDITPQELAKLVPQLTSQQLAKLNHAVLYQAREHSGPEMQNKLAAPEHRAFAREATAENPLMALSIALATLGYQPYKMMQGESRSSASVDQIVQGLTGVGEGLTQFGTKAAQDILGAIRF